ncbi:MAG TPA: hypothetical protein VMV77_04945 [Bacteroidales bacterium]|nr:hypothetical protein [Bacteroidales bacterium]
MGIDVLTGPIKFDEDANMSEFKAISFSKKTNIFFKLSPKYEYFLNFSKAKEELYTKAITNLMKKNEFLQLLIQMLQEQISEEEYEEELLKNREKYFIELKAIESPEYYNAIVNICKSLKSSISVDEVSEIFGIKQGDLFTAIEA